MTRLPGPMTGPLVFNIDGHPAPQGSKKPIGHGRMIEDNKRTKPWRELVAWSVRSQLPAGHQPIDGPVLLVALFTMPPPKRRQKARHFPSTKAPGSGDEDKLVRACCDALTTAKVWKDDSRMVRHLAGTDWPGAPGFRSEPGCTLIVAPIDGDYLADLVTVWTEEVIGVLA